MVLALADYLDTNWEIVWWTVTFVGIASLLAQSVVVLRRSTLFGSYNCLAIGAIAALIIVVGWHSFGWETLHTDTGWKIRRHRMLGRVTLLAYDTDGNWFADAKVLYKWSDPWVPNRESKHDYKIAMEDRDGDGRWDTWWEPTGESEDGDAVLLLRGDTDMDGKPDFEARELASTSASSYEELKDRRGF